MQSQALLIILVFLTMVSCRNAGSSDLSEVVGRSQGETIKERSDNAFVTNRSGPQSENETHSANGTATASFEIFERYTLFHEEERFYTDYVWDETLERSTGTEAAWGGYFLNDVPQRDKPELLANAVIGIGQPTAEAIAKLTHQGAPLSKRPKGWEDFKNEIKEIDKLFEGKDKYKHLRGVYKNVVMDNGGQNIKKLAYQMEGQELKPIRRKQLIQWSTVEKEFRDRYDWRVPVVVRVRGVRLLPTETETFRVFVSENDEDDARISISSDFADYQVNKERDRRGVVFNLSGRRKAARPPNKVSVSVARAGEAGISVKFTDTAASQLGEFAGRVVVDFSVRRDTNRWFTEKNLGDHSITLNGGSGSKTINVPKLKSGENFVVSWTMRRENSSAYDGNKSSDSETRNLSVN